MGHFNEKLPFILVICALIVPATPCCVSSSTIVNLRNGTVTDGGVGEVINKPEGTPSSATPCNLRALIKVTFDKLPSCITGCASYPLCGRRMLRIDLDLSSGSRSGFMFNIGDSVSNDGYRGDYNDQFHDSEIDSIPPNVYVRPSDVCPNQPLLATYTDAVKSGSVSRVTLFISNGHVRITNSNGLNQKLCDQCLFALNGQADPSYGGANEDIYIALNRVITGRSDRYGVGVCSAKLSWVCPEFF
ncbi:uncharacterized protein LOC127861128 [Dreissena polymorpha]|uniref:Uncharacterized protein n=1 Tax=Dreissena polymorpha TaxID=45954 RepID=A0A9D4BQQ0_DREPO|nr:uncharacterized protein LOC127860857 [Dreissena polymorpha]XP_052255463.1 uncharacterized protein LOC127861128 [Dreissena polymorpha]KAH3701672.1 hypothetical protein DPMN_076663 [Dreissena polymorpha]KAH3701737.1 hypothetical protein DPMN_076731 [Dreissena polymorpha]